MSERRIGFIGGGNMAAAIIGGLKTRGFATQRIAVSDPQTERRQILRNALPDGLVTEANEAVVEASDALVLAVKPQIMAAVLQPLREVAQRRRPLIISIAAGIPAEAIDRWLGGDLAVVRCMPNQPALLGEGMTVLFANDAAVGQREIADEVLTATGPTLWVSDESMIDAATAISGSGPAYFFYLMETMIDVACEFGFDQAEATRLVRQTAIGAAAIAGAEDEDVGALRARVTSPGGTTAAAVEVLDAGQVRAIFRRALQAAKERAEDLAAGAAAD